MHPAVCYVPSHAQARAVSHHLQQPHTIGAQLDIVHACSEPRSLAPRPGHVLQQTLILPPVGTVGGAESDACGSVSKLVREECGQLIQVMDQTPDQPGWLEQMYCLVCV